MTQVLKFFFGALLLVAATATNAKNWPETQGWIVEEAGDDSCGIRMEYEGKGSTRFTLLKYLDGNQVAIIDNYNWSAKKDNEYFVMFSIDGEPLTPSNFSQGTVDGIYKGFILGMDEKAMKSFVGGTTLKVYFFPEIDKEKAELKERFGDPILIDQLSLDGSQAAVLQMNRCLANVRKVADAERREKEKYDHLPDDPFKK